MLKSYNSALGEAKIEITNGSRQGTGDESDFYEYPYLDTMSYLNENDGCLYNYPRGDGKELRDTGGGYDEYSE